MSVRYNLVNELIAHIAELTGSQGFRGLRFLHEINDFPSFYIHVGREQRSHRSSREQISTIDCAIRGYLHSNSLDEVEAYVRGLETAIDSFSSQCAADSIRVLSVRTDEGLMLPYGICDLTIQILYRTYP